MTLVEKMWLESQPGLKTYCVFVAGREVARVTAQTWADAMRHAMNDHGWNAWVAVVR